jgi:hypothetical protein
VCTQREQKMKEFYEKIRATEQLSKEINELADDLANETKYHVLRLYKEQWEQIEEIQAYFKSVDMHPENNTEDAIISVALQRFHEFIKSL